MDNELDIQKTHHEAELAGVKPAETSGLRRALAITMISLLVWFGFRTTESVVERNSLMAISSNFQAGMQQAEKMRAQLQTLITKTAELASKGNPNAKAAILELQKKGIPVPSAK